MSQKPSESSFRLLVENGFLSANVKLQLLDENMLLLDSLNKIILLKPPHRRKWARN